MGLDGVELVMTTEERFGIEITDEEAEAVRTVGDLIELVSGKLSVGTESTCFTRKAFYLLRRTLMRITQTPRARIRPGTAVQALPEAADSKQFWQKLQTELGARNWPELEYPGRISFAIGTASILIFAGDLWGCLRLTSFGIWTWLFGLAFALAASILFAEQLARVTASLRTEIPDSSLTVGSLANFIVNRNPDLISVSRDQWTQERIRLCVKEVISEQLGLPMERLHDDARFVQDLHLD
jgi:acyl carrier protein